VSSQVKLSAQPRTATGKGDAKRLRRDGRVPGILYGYDVEPTALSVDARELYHVLHGPAGRNAMISLDLGSGPVLTVARDIQRHTVRREVTHVDFLAVDRDVRIDVEIPVHLVDLDDVARDGGYLNHVRHVIPISVRPLDTPDFIEVSVAGMAIGDVKRLGDIIALLPAGAEIADDPDRVIVTITAPLGAGGVGGTEGGTTEAASDGAAAAEGAATT
jgi:large subunit ribosomal protein L25